MKSELVANFWPVVDGTTGLIQRVLARAYVVAGGDAAIGARLIPRFPQAPYIITTFLLEASDGTLTPQLPG